MRTLKDINLSRLVIEPDTVASIALLEMQRAAASAAGVIKDGELLGIVTVEACILSDSESPVRDVMRGASTRFQIEDPVRQAAKSFVRLQADYLAVYDGDNYVGLLSALMLITELGRSWDPLTGLSWSDRLRDWGVECLEAGQEITIVFFDLNDFGEYNKKYGHTVGDRVIWGFGALLNRVIDPSRDVLVRYGGDEFAIGTTRDRKDTIAMLTPVESREFKVDGVEAPIGFSYGISGGKRTQEPSRDHVAATLDNLINLASQDCIANKPGSILVKNGTALDLEPKPTGSIQILFAGTAPGRPESVRVELAAGSIKAIADQKTGHSRYLAIAEATARALFDLDPRTRISVNDLAFRFENGERKIVFAGRKEEQGQTQVEVRVESKMNGDLDRSVAKSVLKVFRSAKLV